MRHLILLNGTWPNTQGQRPIYFNRSISCYQLKHWLSHFGFKCQVIDYCQLLTSAEIIALIDNFKSEDTFAIGVSTSFWPVLSDIPPNLKEVLDHAREKWPDISLIAGGARNSTNTEMFDKVFAGESEDALVEWCQNQVGKKGRSLFNKKFDITQLSHRFDVTDAILSGEVLPIELGRGCIFKCRFCSHHNIGKAKHTYQRDHSLILAEMAHNFDQWGTTRYNFLDDTVNEDIDKVERLSKIKHDLGFGIEWVGYLRADLLWSKPHTVEQIKESGLKSCLFGIETFNAEAGRSIDKGWAAKHGKEFLPKLYHDLWGGDINVFISLIAGLPGETVADLRQTKEWCMTQDIGWHRFNALSLYNANSDPHAQSEFTRNHDKYGYTDINDRGYWKNGDMTSALANHLASSFNRELDSINRISCWHMFSAANLGYDPMDVRHWSWEKYLEHTSARVDIFKTAYIEKLRSVPM